MPDQNLNIAFQRSEQVQEIVSNKPGFLVRHGITFLFLTLCIVGLACWFIRYPDTVPARALLTSINPPKPVITNIAGKIVKLNAEEGKFVQKGQLLGFIESRADHNEVMMLDATADTLQSLLQAGSTESIPKYLTPSFGNLGEMQQPYQSFMQAFILFKQYLFSGYYLQKKAMLHGDISYLQRLHANLLQQKGLNEQDLNLSQSNFDANTSLNNDKVIADVEYRNENSKLIGKKLTLPQVSSAIIANESQQHEKEKEILELENNIAQQKEIFAQSLNTLKSQLEDWKNKFVLMAPVDGKIAFASFIQENQQLKQGQTVCFINPENSQYYAEILIPQSNLGKVETGQKVLLKFPSYPFQEFGALEGKIDFISRIPTDSGYNAKIILPAGLRTSYQKQIQYRDGLQAQAEIITKDMRLLQRFYYSIAKQAN